VVAEIEQFGSVDLNEREYLTAQGEIYLKTNSGLYKQRYSLIMGNEIYFQKSVKSSRHDFMHCLTGTFIDIPKDVQQEGEGGEVVKYYPIKI
jgi:hypothetical protein